MIYGYVVYHFNTSSKIDMSEKILFSFDMSKKTDLFLDTSFPIPSCPCINEEPSNTSKRSADKDTGLDT